MTLDACRKDFEALIKRIVLQKAYENSDAKSRYVLQVPAVAPLNSTLYTCTDPWAWHGKSARPPRLASLGHSLQVRILQPRDRALDPLQPGTWTLEGERSQARV